MKLKECGEIYKLNSDNVIVNPKDNEAEVETSGAVSYTHLTLPTNREV